MRILNKTHSNLINGMLSRFSIDLIAENASTKEIVEALLCKVNRPGIDKLMSYLSGHDFYTAPASTKFHGNYEGALAEHSINVCALLARENDMNELGLSDENIIVSSLLHDLCKMDFYISELKNVKTYINEENRSSLRSHGIKKEFASGEEREYAWVPTMSYGIEDTLPLGHGEKSMYIAMSFIKLDRTEAFLIRWHMGPFSSANQYDFNNAIEYQKSVAAIYVADLLAASLYEMKI